MEEMHISLGDRGNMLFSTEIIEKIAVLTMEKSDLEIYLCENMLGGFKEKIGIKGNQKCIKASYKEGEIQLDMKCEVRFGADIPFQAEKAKKEITEAVFAMTGVEIEKINIHICAIKED